jgi:hypothetical protein
MKIFTFRYYVFVRRGLINIETLSLYATDGSFPFLDF